MPTTKTRMPKRKKPPTKAAEREILPLHPEVQEQGLQDDSQPEQEPQEQEDNSQTAADQDVTGTQSQEQPPSGQTPIEQQPGQNGKSALPVAEDDPEQDSEEEDEEKYEEKEAEPVFTDQDREDLPLLESNVKHHGLEQARAIREIRQRKLWMLHRNDDGSRKYTTYDHYVEDHHGHSRQWASQQTKWLAVIEKLQQLRSKGAEVPEMVLSADAANGLHNLEAAGGFGGSTKEEQEEHGLLAVIEEAQHDGLRLDRDNLRAVCDRRVIFYLEKKKGVRPPAAADYPAYKQDCLVVKALPEGGKFNLVRDVKELPGDGDFSEKLIKTCTEQRKWPRPEELLTVLTGRVLEEIVPRLKALAEEAADTTAKLNRFKTVCKEIKAMQQDGPIGELREEEKALREALEEKGVIKKRGGTPSKNGDGEPNHDSDTTPSLNEVRQHLDDALESLKDALDAYWPEAGNTTLLDDILTSAKDCNDVLTDILDKARQLKAPITVTVLTAHGKEAPDTNGGQQ